MLYKKIRKIILESEMKLEDKLFILLSGVALLSMITIFFVGIAIGESFTDLLMVGGAVVIAGLLSVFAILKRKISIMATVFSFLLVFFLLPVTFFTGGGILGGGPLWFVFSILFISLTLKGKIRGFFFFAQSIIAIICYGFASYYNCFRN